VSSSHLDARFLRIRAADTPLRPTAGFATFGEFEICSPPDSPYPMGFAGRNLLLEEAVALDEMGLVEGIFERLGARPGAATRAGDLEAAGVLVVMVDNLEPARDADFNRWYDDVHVPDILSAGSFHWVTRYRAVGPAPEAAYLAVYETDWPEPEAALQAMAARPKPAGLWDAIAAVHLAAYRRH